MPVPSSSLLPSCSQMVSQAIHSTTKFMLEWLEKDLLCLPWEWFECMAHHVCVAMSRICVIFHSMTLHLTFIITSHAPSCQSLNGVRHATSFAFPDVRPPPSLSMRTATALRCRSSSPASPVGPTGSRPSARLCPSSASTPPPVSIWTTQETT